MAKSIVSAMVFMGRLGGTSLMSSISTLSPASTYPDLFQIANGGQGLTTTPSQVQDGLGNLTNISISSNYINFDRGIAQFKIDSIPLTADINTLNNISDVANGAYVLLSPNAQLANGLILQVGPGLSLSSGGGNVTISPSSILAGLQQLNAGPTGIVVNQGGTFFDTVNLISDATINIVNPNGVSGNPTFNVIPDTCVQRINVQLNGIFESRKSQLNFIPGPGAGINVVDDPGNNRTNITISAPGGGGGGSGFTVTITQAAHGLDEDDVIRCTGSNTFVKAQADSAANSTSVVGIVSEVLNPNQFIFQFGGIVTFVALLTPGDPYFLDPAVAGGFTSVIPNVAGEVVLPLFYALTTNRALWQPKSAIELM